MKCKPGLDIKKMADELRTSFGARCGKTRLYRVRRKGQDKLEGDYSGSYDNLPKYAEILRKKNPCVLLKISYDRVPMDLNLHLKDFFLVSQH